MIKYKHMKRATNAYLHAIYIFVEKMNFKVCHYKTF